MRVTLQIWRQSKAATKQDPRQDGRMVHSRRSGKRLAERLPTPPDKIS